MNRGFGGAGQVGGGAWTRLWPGAVAGLLLTGCLRPVVEPAKASAPDSIYFVLVDRFANGDRLNDETINLEDPQAFHGGDLQGVIDHLDHIQGLGFRTVWLSPVFKMRTEPFFGHGAFHGYWVQDPTRIEPRMGETATLRRLSDALHDRGMRLMLDVVYNHVSFDSPLREANPQWFHPSTPIIDWNDPVQKVVHEVHGLPDLAQEKEEVYTWLREWSVAWINEVQPDGFRLDAVGHMPISFLARISAELRQQGELHMLGEVYDGDPMVLASTRREGGLDQVFDFPLHFAMLDVFCRGAHPGRIGATLALDSLFDDGAGLVPFLDNHDRPRVRSVCGEDPNKVGQALRFLLSARGTPALTYGTESGLTGAEEPLNRGDMRFGVGAPEEDVIRRWLPRRRESTALTQGVGRTLFLSDTLLVHARFARDEVAIITVNQGDQAVDVPLPGALRGPALDLETRSYGPIVAAANAVTVVLKAGDFRDWLTPPPEVSVTLPAEGYAAVVGTGPWLGNWKANPGLIAVSDSVTVKVRAGAVLEYKPMTPGPVGDAWTEGPNRYSLAGAAEAARPGARP